MKAVIEALQVLRGIAQVAAVTLVAELREISRFAKPTLSMGYSGLVPSDYSSGSPREKSSLCALVGLG
jgi:transposase